MTGARRHNVRASYFVDCDRCDSRDYRDVGRTSVINQNPIGTIETPTLDNNGQSIPG